MPEEAPVAQAPVAPVAQAPVTPVAQEPAAPIVQEPVMPAPIEAAQPQAATPVAPVETPVFKIPVTTNKEEQQVAIDTIKAMPPGGMIEMNGVQYRKNDVVGWDIESTANVSLTPVSVTKDDQIQGVEETLPEANVFKIPDTKNKKERQAALDTVNAMPVGGIIEMLNGEQRQRNETGGWDVIKEAPVVEKKPLVTKRPNDPALETESIALADRAEAAGQKSFADVIRNRINNMIEPVL
jgi:hypothetical protein